MCGEAPIRYGGGPAMTADTTEQGLESLICTALAGHPCNPLPPSILSEPVAGYGGVGWSGGTYRDYDREYCVDLAQLAAFLHATQPEEAWALALDEDGPTRRKFLARLRGEVTKRGAVDVLRHGLKHGAHNLDLFYGMPSPGNERARERFEQNRFTVTRQLRYSRDETQRALDIVLLINGLPVITFELKNNLTKQTADDAVRQYRKDRDPRERLFELGRCLAHFAVDESEARFCTHLEGKASWFLPFNRGWNDEAGNPPKPSGIKTDYLWREVLTRQSLTEIVENYAQLVESRDEKTGEKKGSISETYAWSCRRGLKAGSRRWLLAEFHEMEPPQIAVQVLGGDAPEAAQEALDLAVAAVDRLDVHGPPDALAGGGVDALVTDIERRRDGRIATVGVGDQQRVRGEDRLQHLSDVVCVQRRQGMAEGRAGPVGGDQDRHLLAREAALAGLAAASARLAIQLPLPLAALENEGLIRLHDPGKPIRRLAHRREKAVAPAMRRARRNPAARGRRLDRLALGKRGAEGKPALLVVQPGQRRPRERSKGLPAALAPKPAQTARLAPRHRTAGAAMRAAPLLVDTQLDCRQRGRALRRVGQHRCNLLALRRRQLVDTRKPLPKALVIHLSDPKGKPETILSQCIQITN